MRRILTIAEVEFLALVRSKFFLISLVIMPVLFGAVTAFLGFVERRADRDERRFAVIDETGVLYGPLSAKATEHSQPNDNPEGRSSPRFVPEPVDPAGRSRDEIVLNLSDRARRGEIFAFVYIPRDVLTPGSTTPIEYYSQNTAYLSLVQWLDRSLDEVVRTRRLENAGLDPATVSTLVANTTVSSFGLVERQVDGTVMSAREVGGLERLAVPVFYMIVMFMAVMSNAQHLINSTIEEKVSKISEALLGSVSAFELLAGKLLGIVAVSFLLAFVYLAGGAYALFSFGRPDLIDLSLVIWFLLFLVAASLLYGSMFQALSSACSDLKDAQTLLQPAMMVLMLAYFSSFVILKAPDSSVATALSFIPLVTPFGMLLRLAAPPGPPMWQLLLSIVMLASVTVVTVWIAGRIFRVGLLMQGKPPNLPELLRWIRR